MANLSSTASTVPTAPVASDAHDSTPATPATSAASATPATPATSAATPLQVQAPPQLMRPVPQPLAVKAMPLVMLLAAGGVVALMLTSGGSTVARNPLSLMFPAMMALSTVAMLVGSWQGGNQRAEMAEKRRDYLRYLDLTRSELSREAELQRTRLELRWPAPDTLALRLVAGPRPLPAGSTLAVRLGLGTVELDRPIIAPETGPIDDLEPVSVAALRRLLHAHSFVREAPVACELTSYPVISCYGEPDDVRAMVRAVVAQIAAHASPDEVRVAAVCGSRESQLEWDRLKWLPHHLHDAYVDGAGQVRLAESTLKRMELLLGDPPAVGEPHVVVIVDGDPKLSSGWLDPDALPTTVTLLEICTAPTGRLRSAAKRSGLALDLVGGKSGQRLHTAADVGGEDLVAPDLLATTDADAVFRTICQIDGGAGDMSFAQVDDSPDFAHTATDSSGSAGGGPPVATREPHGRARTRRSARELDVLAAFGHLATADLRTRAPGTWDAATAWRHRTGSALLRVPIGLDDGGNVIHLDLKEAAHGGNGPHGLCVGATGSGKSEFLRTLVLGLVATHSPQQLNLVLIDFKGGATFRGMEAMHHVAASITNLAEEMTLVERMRDALEGELVRRQELLRATGFPSAAEYERARAGGRSDLVPLPALLIVADEFSELLAARPDFIDLFVQIGRLGRSLHIHLLLASQRLEEGRLRGLESHLSFRIALKTFSAAESRVVLGTSDAYTLPGKPGAAYLKVDADEPRRFATAYVSGPMARGAAAAGQQEFVPTPARLREFSARYLPVAEPLGRASADETMPNQVFSPETSPWDVCLAQLSGVGTKAHAVWLDPLPAAIPMETFGDTDIIVPQGPEVTAEGCDVALAAYESGPGFPSGAAAGGTKDRAIPWAVVDRPFEQRHDLLALDLAHADSAALVVGAPRSGKSAALVSLALAAALRYRPDELHIYGLDFGGGELEVLDALPHTAGIARRANDGMARRILSELQALLRRREGVAEQSATRLGTQAQVLVLIDGWHAARAELDDLDAAVGTLAAEGLGCGIHVVVTAARLMDVRPVVRDALSLRLELRLVDPADSMLGRRGARTISAATPGRGVIESGHLIQILTPREGATAAASAITDAWQDVAPGIAAPRVRLLPERLPFAELSGLIRRDSCAGRAHECLRVPVGIEESDLGPAYLDLAAEPLVLAFGNAGSGKTSLLRGLARALVEVTPEAELRILLVDFRRQLRGVVPPGHLAGIASSEEELAPMITHLSTVLRERLAAIDSHSVVGIPPTPRIVVLVDDVDLVAGSAGNPLAPLVPLLAHARDVGLSLLLTRRVSGAARAAFDPVVQRMRDLGAAGLVMDGTRDEGRLVGDLVARPLPPGRAQYHSRATGTRLWQLAEVGP